MFLIYFKYIFLLSTKYRFCILVCWNNIVNHIKLIVDSNYCRVVKYVEGLM